MVVFGGERWFHMVTNSRKSTLIKEIFIQAVFIEGRSDGRIKKIKPIYRGFVHKNPQEARKLCAK